METVKEAGYDVIRKRPRWIHIGGGQDRGWTFVCEYCRERVYWPQPTRGNRDTVCPYPMCPWCGTAMGGIYGQTETERTGR